MCAASRGLARWMRNNRSDDVWQALRSYPGAQRSEGGAGGAAQVGVRRLGKGEGDEGACALLLITQGTDAATQVKGSQGSLPDCAPLCSPWRPAWYRARLRSRVRGAARRRAA